MKLLKYFISFLIIASCGILTSCKEDDPKPDPGPVLPQHQSKRTVLIYAVASNDLYYDWLNDRDEILQGAARIDGLGEDIQVAIYSVIPKEETPTLSWLTKVDGDWTFSDVKVYDRSRFSTDPERMKEVIGDVFELFPAENFGLVMWSHATGWTPSFSDHQMNQNSVKKAFGQEIYNPDGTYRYVDQCDIIELVEAIPEGLFDYVWFDCCYMGSIEVAAEMSSKVPMMVAYPSEVWSEGMPYDIILPYITAPEADIVGGARKFSEYFTTKNRAFTIGVYDLASADFANIANRLAEALWYDVTFDNYKGAQNYARSPYGPFYDVYDLSLKSLAMVNTVQPAQNVRSALKPLVIYRDCSEVNLSGRPWYKELYSGISAHRPATASSEAEEYYAKTKWGKLLNDAIEKTIEMHNNQKASYQ